jgi:uncharacterized membrane protein
MRRKSDLRRSNEQSSRSGISFSAEETRKLALIGGCTLALFGLTRKSKSGLALATMGGLMAYAGSKQQDAARFHAESSFSVNCSPQTAFQFWRNLENLPRFMRHLDSVRDLGNGRSEWAAIGPLDTRVQWTAEIVNERENAFIAWRSLPGSDLHNSGSVEFKPAPGGRGTLVTVRMDYEPAAGAVGKAAAAILGKNPDFAIREDLRRFKALLEAGEIPTTEGQPHGPRSALISALHTAYPEKRKPTEFAVGERQMRRRRAS